MLKRTSLGPGRARYRVHRPQWPTTIVSELTYVVVVSISGAGGITFLLWAFGLVR